MLRWTRLRSHAGFLIASAVLVTSGCASHDALLSVAEKQRSTFDGLFAGGGSPSSGNIFIEGPDGSRTTRLVGFVTPPPNTTSWRVVVTLHLEDGAGTDVPLSDVDIELCRDPSDGVPCEEDPEGTLTYSQESDTDCGEAGCLTKVDGTLTITTSELFVGTVQFHYEDEVVSVGDESCSPSLNF